MPTAAAALAGTFWRLGLAIGAGVLTGALLVAAYIHLAIGAGFVARGQSRRQPHAVGGGTMALVGTFLGFLNLFISALAVVYYLSTAG